MNWLGQGMGSCRDHVLPCAPLLLLFLVVTSLSGACLLELLCHPVIWDCTSCPMLVLVLAGSLWTNPSCVPQLSRCLPATADAQAFREVRLRERNSQLRSLGQHGQGK